MAVSVPFRDSIANGFWLGQHHSYCQFIADVAHAGRQAHHSFDKPAFALVGDLSPEDNSLALYMHLDVAVRGERGGARDDVAQSVLDLAGGGWPNRKNERGYIGGPAHTHAAA